MPNWKTHFAISTIRTGKKFEELHKWIDENKEEDKGVNHRDNGKHVYTEENRKFVYDNFGGNEAVSEWLFHIAIDSLDTSITNDWKNRISDENFYRFGFGKDGYIFYEGLDIGTDGLRSEFEDAYAFEDGD